MEGHCLYCADRMPSCHQRWGNRERFCPCAGQSTMYTLQNMGTLCNVGNQIISESQCQEAAIELSTPYGITADFPNCPAGCLKWSGDGQFHFNTHATSTASSKHAPVCLQALL